MSGLFVSIDIEADGRIPGVISMLSFGSAAFTIEEQLVTCFERNLDPPPHSHVALVDAIGQGALGFNIIREARGLVPIDVIANASCFDLSAV